MINKNIKFIIKNQFKNKKLKSQNIKLALTIDKC